ESVNFRTLITLAGNGIDVDVPVESIRAISERFGKYGLVKSMLNSSTGLFLFQFSFMDGLDSMLENGSWFIRNNPLILKKWNPDVDLLKEDVVNVSVWVKLHGVPMIAFSEDGLSVVATKLGTLLILDSCTSDMCMESWVRSSYARAMIKLWDDVDLKDTIMVAMPKLVKEGFYTCTVRVKYEWKSIRCTCCKVFGHVQDECPKNTGSDVVKNLKKPSQAPKGVSVGPKVGFKPAKQVYRQVSKKNNINTSGKKKKDVEANSSGSSFWNTESSSISTTPIVEKIDKLEKLIIDRKIKLVDDEGKPLKKVDYPGDHDSEDEVAPVDNEMESFLGSKRVGYGNNSLLEQWRDTYENADYEYDPYDDDMYEGQDIPDNMQSISDNLDIKLRGHKKK
ncbi:putative reverse transcriptase domain-containing protein, partial [Tanacetum coccineum]